MSARLCAQALPYPRELPQGEGMRTETQVNGQCHCSVTSSELESAQADQVLRGAGAAPGLGLGDGGRKGLLGEVEP